MKKLKWVVIGILVVGMVVVSTLFFAITVRERMMTDYESFTLDELDQFVAKRGLSAVWTESATNSEAVKNATAKTPLPDRLERAPSPEALTKVFVADEHSAALVARMMKVSETAQWIFGTEESELYDWTNHIGEALMKSGEWDAARGYLYEALEMANSKRITNFLCARLAWLEEDPEKAAHLLGLSLQGDEEWLSQEHDWPGTQSIVVRNRRKGIMRISWRAELLANAVELTMATGSDSLAEHYLGQLRVECPELALTFDR